MDYSLDIFTDQDLKILLQEGKTMSPRFYLQVKTEMNKRKKVITFNRNGKFESIKFLTYVGIKQWSKA